jgi:hypothetical protein
MGALKLWEITHYLATKDVYSKKILQVAKDSLVRLQGTLTLNPKEKTFVLAFL